MQIRQKNQLKFKLLAALHRLVKQHDVEVPTLSLVPTAVAAQEFVHPLLLVATPNTEARTL